MLFDIIAYHEEKVCEIDAKYKYGQGGRANEKAEKMKTATNKKDGKQAKKIW